MREASEKRKELERLHTEALAQLRDTQSAASANAASAAAASASAASASAAGGDKAKSFETIDALQVSRVSGRTACILPGTELGLAAARASCSTEPSV